MMAASGQCFPGLLTNLSLGENLAKIKINVICCFLLTHCNNQNNFITMWSCLWKHAKFIGTVWRIHYRNIVERSARLGANKTPHTNTKIAAKRTDMSLLDVWFVVLLPSFPFFSHSWPLTSQEIPVSDGVSHWCQPMSLHGCCLYAFVQMCILCVLPKTLQATGKSLLDGCRHRYSVLKTWPKKS